MQWSRGLGPGADILSLLVQRKDAKKAPGCAVVATRTGRCAPVGGGAVFSQSVARHTGLATIAADPSAPRSARTEALARLRYWSSYWVPCRARRGQIRCALHEPCVSSKTLREHRASPAGAQRPMTTATNASSSRCFLCLLSLHQQRKDVAPGGETPAALWPAPDPIKPLSAPPAP